MKKYRYMLSLIAFLVMSFSNASGVEHLEMPDELSEAIIEGDLQAVRRMIEQTPMLLASVHRNGRVWPAHIAAEHNRLDIYLFLLEQAYIFLGERAREFLEVVDGAGRTALHYAVQNGSEEFASSLIDLGASIYARSGHETPMNYALVDGYFTTVKLLCMHGYDLSERRGYNNFVRIVKHALMMSDELREMSNFENILRYIVRHGADVTAGQKSWIEPRITHSNVEQERQVIGNTLEEMHFATGFSQDVNKLILSFLSEYLRVPDSAQRDAITRYEAQEWEYAPPPPAPVVIDLTGSDDAAIEDFPFVDQPEQPDEGVDYSALELTVLERLYLLCCRLSCCR